MLLGFRRLDFLLFCQAQAILSGEGEAKEVDFHVNSRSDCTPFQGSFALFCAASEFCRIFAIFGQSHTWHLLYILYLFLGRYHKHMQTSLIQTASSLLNARCS